MPKRAQSASVGGRHKAPGRRLRTLVCVAALLGATGLAGPTAASELRRTAIVEAVAGQRDAVVNLHGQKMVAASDDPEDASLRRVNGMGTGVVIDARGYIVTNYHVVEGVRRIEVTLASGEETVAELVSHDARTDLAIVKVVPPKPLQVIRVGRSRDIMIGETVLALGNAFGYEHTVTRGIVSALHRDVEVTATQRYEDLIQTDASINPGNSGGPLLNIDGEMIGLNVAVRAGAQGIGFAIPVDKVVEVAARLLSVERVSHTWHGIVASGTDSGGAMVATVQRESPAAAFGVRAGDVIRRIGGMVVDNPLDIERALLGRKVGETVDVQVDRDGTPQNITLALSAAPAGSLPVEERIWQELGLRLATVPAERIQRMQSRYRGGLRVVDVREGGPACDQGIQAGDVLVGLHVWETVSPENVVYVLDKAQGERLGALKFYVLRGRETLFGHLSRDTIRR
jgi:serine protease Do